MKRFLSFVLSLTALFTCVFGVLSSGTYAAEEDADTGTGGHLSISDVLGDHTPSKDGMSLDEIEYFHYDTTDFYAAAEQLAVSEDLDEMTDLFDYLYNELAYEDSLWDIAIINAAAGQDNEYWSAEGSYSEETCYDMLDAICEAGGAAIDSQDSDSFADYVGDHWAELFRTYRDADGRISELHDEEDGLIAEYDAILSDPDVIFVYDGVEWSYDLLYGDEGNELYEDDLDAYTAVEDGLNAALAEEVGALYLELVANRNEQAALFGYDDYAEYGYALSGMDFTSDETQAFCDAAVPVIREFLSDDLAYSDIRGGSGDVVRDMDVDEMIALTGSYLKDIDDDMFDAWAYMVTYDLYDYGLWDEGFAGWFFVYLSYYGLYYLSTIDYADTSVYGTFTGLIRQMADYVSFYTTDYDSADIDYMLDDYGNYAVKNTYSALLALLTMDLYDEIYSENADTARWLNMMYLMYDVADGCLYDDFQRAVYSDPDMTVDELSQLFADLCDKYGQEEYGMYDWVWCSRLFTEPMYDISEAVDMFAAVQIWANSQDGNGGHDADAYLISQNGVYNISFDDLLADNGLRGLTEDGAVEDAFRPLLDMMIELDEAYDG